VPILATALVAGYMARQPDEYQAEAQVQVDLETVNTAVTASRPGTLAVNPVNDPAYFNTQLQLLTRPRLLRRVVKTLGLENDPAFRLQQAAASPSWWRQLPVLKSLAGGPAPAAAQAAREEGRDDDGGASARETSREELAEAERLAPYVEAIRAGLRAEPVKEIRLPIKETRLINITFRHPDRRVATKVVNAVADAFVLQNLERKTEANDVTTDILEERIGELQAQVRRQESQLLDYAKGHQILSLDAGENTVVERLVGLNRQLLEAENERKLAEAAYNAARAPGAADALAEVSAKEAAESEAKLAELRQRRAQLLVETTEEWPEVKEVDNQIAVLERQLSQTRERASSVVLTNLGTRYRQALAREQALRGSFDRQRAETLTQNEAAINYRIIQQEIETNKRLLDGMLQRSKENEAIFAGMRNNIHVNDYAVTPQDPVGPRRLLNTAVAFALSLGVGIGLAVFLGYMDNSVRSTDDVRRALSLPTLAAIPAVGSSAGRRLRHAPGGLLGRNGNGNGNGQGNGHTRRELLLSDAAPAPLTEAYRQLRTTMLLSPANGEMKSLLVTSSAPGEGKTTMAVNTAVSLSRTGALVLLIDADMRKPRLHTVFGLANESGLSTILSDETDDGEALKTIIHHRESGLDVLPSGPPLAESTELLGSGQMQRLVGTFRSVYDYVVIDSPPLAYFSDGVMISSLVDGVVLVANSGKSSREAMRQSYQLLAGAGANVCGVVLNNVKGAKDDYKNYYNRG
jgi:capsular exopolysaccharide synthesis family protein